MTNRVHPLLVGEAEAMRRAIDDIRVRSDRIFPAHDPAIAPEQLDNFGE